MANSKVPLRRWAIAIYLCVTSLTSVSSMKLHRDIGVSQPTAWFMLHRIREAWAPGVGFEPFEGPVEMDETYIGGRRANMSNAQRAARAGWGRGPVDMTAVVGAKDRSTNTVTAEVIDRADQSTVEEFAGRTTAPGAAGRLFFRDLISDNGPKAGAGP